MNRFSRVAQVTARLLMCAVFLLNGLGVIDQSVPAKELILSGAPPNSVPVMMAFARVVELLGGLAMLLGIYPRVAALALLAFLIPATFTAHSFWLSAGTPAFQGQLINFSKNVAMWGGLCFMAGTSSQPSLFPKHKET
jgi:putative oxidoreductase